MEQETDLANLAKLKVAKVKCLKDFLFHIRYFFVKQYMRKFVIGEHHRIICEAMERIFRGELKRLIINIAPRYGKTEVAVKNAISHGLALNPAAKFIHLSYGDDIALDNSESVKDLVMSADYQSLFPEVKIKKDSKAKDKWYTTKGGGVLARAAAGQVTGFGAGQVDIEKKELKQPAVGVDVDWEEFLYDITEAAKEQENTDLDKKFRFGGAIIIDDPIKPEDADQDTIREKVNSRFDSTIRSRVNSRHTPIIVIMQRLHPNDLAGYLMRPEESDKWEVISLPCIKEDGTALWEFKHTIEELQALEKSNDIVFARQYQQNPKPKAGLMFPIDDLQMYSHEDKAEALDDCDYAHFSVDPANLGGDDFASIFTKLIGNKIHVTDVLYNLEGEDINSKAVVDTALATNMRSGGIEGVFGWKETAIKIRGNLSKKGFKGEVRVLKPRTAKHVRISSRSAFIRNHFVFRSDWMYLPQYAKFMRNLTTYKKIQEPGKLNKHDEAPDVCEMTAMFYEKQFPALFALPSTPVEHPTEVEGDEDN